MTVLGARHQVLLGKFHSLAARQSLTPVLPQNFLLKKTELYQRNVFGLSLLITAVVLGEAALGEFGEKGLTLLGSIFVAYAHYKNHQACKKIDCDCHEKEQLTSEH